MKRLTLVLLVPLLGLAATPAHAGTTMSQSVLASGGVELGSAHYLLQGTLAQPVIGVVAGVRRVDIGYWQVIGFATSDVDGGTTAPIQHFALGEIFPNPLQPDSKISLLLPQRAHVSVRLYDVAGRVAAVLVDAELGPGTVSASLPTVDLPSGVYLCRMTAAGSSDTRRLVLLRSGR